MRRSVSNFTKYVALALIAAGAVLRLWLVLRHAMIQGDSNLYAEIARNWVEAHTYGFSTDTDTVRPTLIRLPGYPLYLVICRVLFSRWAGTDSFTPALLLQVPIDLGTCLLAALTARNLLRLHNSQKTAQRGFLLALALGCLCPFTASYVATPLAEPLVLFTIAAAFYCFERWAAVLRESGGAFNRYLYWLAAVLGYGILLRPDQALLAAAVVPAMVWVTYRRASSELLSPLGRPVILRDALESRLSRRAANKPHRSVGPIKTGITPALLTLALALLPLVPWTVRNAMTFHVFQPIAPHYATDPGEPVDTGFQRWYRSWAIDFDSTEKFYWKYPDEDLDVAQLPDRAFDTEDQYGKTSQLIQDSNNAPHFHPEIDARFNRIAQDRIAADPLRYYLGLPLARLGNMLFHPRTELLPYDLQWWHYSWHPWQTFVSWLFAGLNVLYFGAGAFGWFRLRRRVPEVAWPCAAFLAMRCILLMTLDNSEQRYTIEFYPLLFLLIPFVLATSRRQPATL